MIYPVSLEFLIYTHEQWNFSYLVFHNHSGTWYKQYLYLPSMQPFYLPDFFLMRRTNDALASSKLHCWLNCCDYFVPRQKDRLQICLIKEYNDRESYAVRYMKLCFLIRVWWDVCARIWQAAFGRNLSCIWIIKL